MLTSGDIDDLGDVEQRIDRFNQFQHTTCLMLLNHDTRAGKKFAMTLIATQGISGVTRTSPKVYRRV